MLTTERADQVPDSTRDLCPPDPTRLYRLHLGPLSLGALHQVVRQETGRSFPRPAMVRIAEGSAGNPFFAVEMARSLTVAGAGGTRQCCILLSYSAVAAAELLVCAAAQPRPGRKRRPRLITAPITSRVGLDASGGLGRQLGLGPVMSRPRRRWLMLPAKRYGRAPAVPAAKQAATPKMAGITVKTTCDVTATDGRAPTDR